MQLPVDFRRHSSAACCSVTSSRDSELTPTAERARSPSLSATASGQTFRRRSFSVTPKGGLVNEGDVVLSPTTPDDTGSRRSSYNSTADNSESPVDSPVYRVLMIGGPGVGKTALTQQFMTSEFMAAQNTSFGQLIQFNLIQTVRRLHLK